jgi:hypothetical protein
MYAVLVELVETRVVYASTLPHSSTASAGTDGMLCCLLGALRFCVIAVYLHEQMVTAIIQGTMLRCIWW